MSGGTVRLLQLLWLVAFVAAGAYLWHGGDAALGAGLVALGFVWEAIGFAVGFVGSFREAVAEAASEGEGSGPGQ